MAYRWVDEVDCWLVTPMRVLDTAALLYWPVTEVSGSICSVSQQAELERGQYAAIHAGIKSRGNLARTYSRVA